jgi:hypothetical protein
MPRRLPVRPNLEQLRQQAKDLLRAYGAGDRVAQRLFAQYLPALTQASRRILLAHAQLVIAREYGFASWAKLKQRIEMPPAEQPMLGPARNRAEQQRLRALRKIAREQSIALIAEQLVVFARDQSLWQLFSTLAIGRYEGDLVRAYLVAHGAYTVVIDALLMAAEHPNARLRFLAAQAMDHFADQRCAEPLQRLLHDPVPRVRWAAIHSLQCAECKLAPLATEGDPLATLIDLALHDPSVKVRRVATYELGQACADPRALAALEAIRDQEGDQAIVYSARQALKRHAQAARPGRASERSYTELRSSVDQAPDT